MTRSALLIYVTITLFVSSCATAPNLARDKTAFDNFCENGRAKKQYVFILASYSGVAPGTSIEKVKSSFESSNRTTEFIRDHFVQAMLVNYYPSQATPDIARNDPFYTLFRQEFVHGWAPVLPHLVWVKDNKFAVCEKASCDGLSYPDSPRELIQFDWQNNADNRCHDFFHEDGYIDGWGCRGNKFGLLSYMKQSGFNGGWLIANTYLAVPESQRQKLCAEAGQPSNCYEKFSSLKEYTEFMEPLANSAQAFAEFPFIGSVMGYPTTWSQFEKMRAESNFSKDLALKAGTKVTTKVLKNWIVHRITWDPSLFCKYGRTNDDFYTR